MLVDATGLLFGTVGGGRVEKKAIECAQQLLASKGNVHSELIEWNLKRDVGMTCGGVVKLFFETYNQHGWQITIFGAGHVAQALVRVLLEVPCRITCIDPRAEWLARLPTSNSKLVVQHSDDMASLVASLSDDQFVLCMTMGHATDRPILDAIFRQGRSFPYLGVIGSVAKRKVLIRELTTEGIDADVAESFRCPIGLDLGTNDPGEIAVSVAAELIQTRDAQVATTE